MKQLEFRAMGCRIFAAIDAIDSDMSLAEAALAQAPDWFEDWESRLSRFRNDSELSRFNSLAGEPVHVSRQLWDVIALALEAAEATEGLVTPTVLPAMQAAGYDRSFSLIVVDEAHTRTQRSVLTMPVADWQRIETDEATRTVRIPLYSALDLGGVAKGWAAHRAAAMLSKYGPALVDAGGDIAVSGPMQGGGAWPVGIGDPFDEAREIGLVALRSGGVATSGRDYRRWKQGDTWKHHIIDPRTGTPANTDVLSVSVVASNLQDAEVAAKAALILGSLEGLAWIEARPNLAALLVLEDGRTLQSTRLGSYLWK